MKVIAVVVAVLFVGTALADVEAVFNAWKGAHGKTYASGIAEFKAFANFKLSLARIQKLNAQAGNTAQYGLTQFSDLSAEEFKATYLMSKFEETPDSERDLVSLKGNVALPTKFDWRQHSKNIITPVKNQGQCGSCWAFPTVENVESMWAMNHSLVELAPQQLVSCDKSDSGCDGGDPPTAYDYIVKVGGLEKETDYPYTAHDGACHFEKSKVAATIKGFKFITKSGDETAMQQGLFEVGPLSICVDATTWQDYRGGVISHNCGTKLDHCVQLMGWNSESAGQEYWIVRNSWGVSWGLQGYLYVEKGKDLCGIAKEATSSII